jgi:hypothetical protein
LIVRLSFVIQAVFKAIMGGSAATPDNGPRRPTPVIGPHEPTAPRWDRWQPLSARLPARPNAQPRFSLSRYVCPMGMYGSTLNVIVTFVNPTVTSKRVNI